MKNPYEVLEIKEGSSKEEIKRAYRELAKKYHPDQYGNNPLKDLAETKMREINEAYDYLMKNTSDSTSYSNTSYNNSYNEIRMDLQRGNLNAAEEKLNRINIRNAEWNYLMGLLSMQKGWYDASYNYLNTACNLDPSNMEYRQAFSRINNNNNAYRSTYYNTNPKSNDCCSMCLCLWCSDSLCECCGGDLISCC